MATQCCIPVFSYNGDEVKRKLKQLDCLVLCIALLEWVGNAAGTLALLWATVVLLGGFCSLLSPADFWFSTVMIFVEATRVFMGNDASVNQWLFGSTKAFRWADFSFQRMLVRSEFGSMIAIIIGVGISLAPLHFRPEVVAGILKVALLVIVSQLLTRLWGRIRWLAYALLSLLLAAAVCGGMYGLHRMAPLRRFVMHGHHLSKLRLLFLLLGYVCGTMIVIPLVFIVLRVRHLAPHVRVLWFIKVMVALGLACFPFLQSKLGSYYGLVSILVSVVLLVLGTGKTSEHDDNNNSSCTSIFLQILDTIMPVLFFWAVMFPLPGISLKMSFYILFPVLAAVLISNMQLPVAFLQLVLSILRLHSLLGHHPHDYHPLPEGASPNMVPSIVVFFVLELCQGSSYIVAIILGLISLPFRRSLVVQLGLTQKLGTKAITLYFNQAYQARMEKGLFASEKQTPSLGSFAIKSLGCTSRERQIAGLCLVNNFLDLEGSESNPELIIEAVKDAKKIIAKITDLISYLITDEVEKSGDSSDYTQAQQIEMVHLSLLFVRRLAINGGKIGTRFRQQLSGNPLFLNNLESILASNHSKPKLTVMYVIETLALDNAARKEIGSSQAIIDSLMVAFLSNNNMPMVDEEKALKVAAGKALANLTIMSPDNCWSILLPRQGQNILIKNLINMLKDDNYFRTAACILHNLCANSRDMLIDLGETDNLGSALLKVMGIIIKTKEREQLESALCVASQIGYVIPAYFAQMLDQKLDIEAAELVTKLVDNLNSNTQPRGGYPRTRRLLVEMVISIVHLCPLRYGDFFIANGAMAALDMVKRTPSSLDKYRVFLGGEGVVEESLPMRDLVEKAKRLIHQATSTSGVQSGDHA